MFSILVVTEGGTSQPEAMQYLECSPLWHSAVLTSAISFMVVASIFSTVPRTKSWGSMLPAEQAVVGVALGDGLLGAGAARDERVVGHGVDGGLEGLDLGVQVGQVGAVVDAERHALLLRELVELAGVLVLPSNSSYSLSPRQE